MRRRDANLILIALAAVGGGVVAVTLPMPLIELGLGTIGVSEILPSFAPPLGDTARALIIGAAMVICALIVAMILPWNTAYGRGLNQNGGKNGEGNMGFFSSVLVMLGGKKVAPSRPGLELTYDVPLISETPVLRRSDSHPDAPARAPVFARRDLGENALPPIDVSPPVEAFLAVNSAPDGLEAAELFKVEQADEQGQDVYQDDPTVPHAAEPLPWNLIEQEMSRILSGTRNPQPAFAEGQGDENQPFANPYENGEDQDHTGPISAATAEMSGSTPPSIQNLVDRLERGLDRKRASIVQAKVDAVRADPVAAMAPVTAFMTGRTRPFDTPTSHNVTSPADEELRRALDALRSTTAKAG